MKLVTVEEHYSSKKIFDEIRKNNSKEQGNNDAKVGETPSEASDLIDMRIAYMDKQGIDAQVISYAGGSAMTAGMDKEQAISICQKINNEMYEAGLKVKKENKNRLYFFAHLPIAYPDEAAKELERCVKEIGFVGAMISGHYKRLFYDDEYYFPIFKKAQELDVPLYLHPGIVSENILKEYYAGKWDEKTAFSFGGYGIGWHYEVGVQVIRMMLAGVFDKLPNLKIILGHWGELVSFYMYRLDEMLDYGVQMKNKFSEYFKKNIYVNPSGMLYKEQFEYCLNTFGVDHILWGEDYPYRKMENIRSFLEKLDISEEDKNKIGYENAKKLLKINL